MINEDLGQYDRITQILKSQSAPQVQELTPQESTSAYARSVVNNSAYGDEADAIQQLVLQRAQQAQDFEMKKQMSIFDIATQRAAAGDKISEKMLERAKLFVGDDAESQAKLLEHLHNSPDEIDPNNAYQLNSAFARGAKELGLRNVDRELELRKKQADIKSTEAMAKYRASGGGGGGGGGVFGARSRSLVEIYKNKFGVEPPPEIQMQIQSAAAAPIPQGMELFFDDNGQIDMRNFGGRVEAAGEIKFEESKSTAEGKGEGDASVDFENLKAAMPQIEEFTLKLNNLSNAATYTAAGKFSNAVKRQLGVEVGDAAEARAELINMIDNDVIPNLKQTLGAQFTEKEGQWLKGMYLDPNLHPKEKEAQLRAWLDNKYMLLETLSRRSKQTEPTGYEGKRGFPTQQTTGGLSPDKKARLEELRAKKAAGTLQ